MKTLSFQSLAKRDNPKHHTQVPNPHVHGLLRQTQTRFVRARKVVPFVFLLMLALTVKAAGQETTTPAIAGDPKNEKTNVVGTLEPGKSVEQQLRGGEEHLYRLNLVAGQYLNLVVEQHGVDVVVTLFDPAAKSLLEIDSPNGTSGPEPVVTVTEISGIYSVSIKSSDKDAPVGSYQVKVIDLRLANVDDRRLIEANRILNESSQLRAQRKLDEALPLAERALAIRENVLGPEHLEVIAIVRDIGALYFEQGNLSRAEPSLQRVLAAKEKSPGPNQLDLAQAQNDLAELYLAKGDFAKAEPLFQRSLAIREKALGPDHPDVATSLNNLGGVYYEQGEYSRVEPLWERALVIVEKTLGPEHPDVADALHSLATLYYTKGDYVRAEPMYLRSLAIREKVLGPEHPYLSLSLNNLAALYADKGDHAKAQPLLQRSLAIREKALGPDHPGVGAALNAMAFHYYSVRDFAKAEPLFQRALAIWEKSLGPAHPQVSIVINNLALLYYARGDYEKVGPLWERSLAIREKALGPDHPDVAKALNNLAYLYLDKGDTAGAEPLYLRALAIRQKVFGPLHPEVAEAFNGLAFLYAAKGDVERAINARARCNDITEHNLALNIGAGSERQKLSYLAQLSGETNSTISLHLLSAADNPEASRLALLTILRRKGRALDVMTDQIRALRRRAQPQDSVLLDNLATMRAKLAVLVVKGPGKTGAEQYQAELRRLEEEIEKLEVDISSRSDEFRLQSQPVTLKAIQRLIPNGTALIEFLSYRRFNPKHKNLAERFGPQRYVAYVLHSRGDPLWVDLGETKTIDGKVSSFRNALRDPTRDDVKQIARSLDELVMRPVRKLLGKSRRLLVSPDSDLNLIPFGALVDEFGHYLIETYSITYLTSGRDLLRIEVASPGREQPLVLANPLFDAKEITSGRVMRSLDSGDSPRSRDFSKARFSSLPGTADEAKALGLILNPGKVLVGANATEDQLKQVKGPRILHVATHGFFLTDQKLEGAEGRDVGLTNGESVTSLENPLLRSGLALAGANDLNGGNGEDGVLTALEAAGLDLWGTQLVVLSACETGVGEIKNGEGVYGLRRAVVLAGAESQVMTLWQVADIATRDLIVSYYKKLRMGLGRGEALRNVQLQMIRSPQRRHPFFWASFIQSGAWTGIDKGSVKNSRGNK